MANQVGVVDTGHIQLRVSYHENEPKSRLPKIGVSGVIGEIQQFHFMLLPPATQYLAARLLDIASRLSNSRFSQVLIKTPVQVSASILDHHRIGLSVQGVGAEVRFTLAPHEVDRLADLLLEALVSGGHMSPEYARWVKREGG